MERDFDVSIEFWSLSLSLAEICERVGLQRSEHSYDIGTPRIKKPSKSANLRIFSRAAGSSDLSEHFQDILEQVRTVDLGKIDRNGMNVGLSVANYFDLRIYSNFDLPAEMVQWASKESVGIEITCYPCTDPSEDPGKAHE